MGLAHGSILCGLLLALACSSTVSGGTQATGGSNGATGGGNGAAGGGNGAAGSGGAQQSGGSTSGGAAGSGGSGTSGSTASGGSAGASCVDNGSACLGKNCGTTRNNCGVDVACGPATCTAPNTCGGGGVPLVCGCTPAACGSACGTIDDGCGSTRQCPGCPNGSSCTDAAECGSGFCVDGVCCATACTSGCKFCNASGNCLNIACGQDPNDTCAGGFCDGNNGCTDTCP